MDRKRILITGGALLILIALVYFQFRNWKSFDWATFWSETHHVNPWHLAHSVALIYVAYVIRAIRWKIFLRPVRPHASSLGLIAPTVVGFTGLALLGRPGELIRPYLIAKRHDLPISSQLAVWAVERIFDIAAFTLLLDIVAFFATAPRRLSYYGTFRYTAVVFTVLVVGLTLGAITVSRSGEALADWVERRFAHLAANLGHRISLRIREFRGGLDTIHSPASLAWLIATSVVMWCMIAVAYKEVIIAYGAKDLQIPQTQVLLLMGSSMVGSLVQLPGVGGGSQLATIATLERIFNVPKELAASCGIMLWLVTFMAVVPLGLLLAHREHISLRKISEESQREEEAAVMSSSPPPVA
jgi:glycosyltransferase 2 family protein